MSDNYYYSSSSSSQSQSTVPLHLCFFLMVLFAFVSFTWYINMDSVFEPFFDGLKLFFMVSPLLLVLAVQLFSYLERYWVYVPFPEQESLHRAGGTPWGVALMLCILFFMVSYQSDLRERWFPLLS
ncbi:OLC1v1001704C1 [Oldenlandia corymbosa var. corymbosa]|uniref:OLC1v1001704C1 n=1 Tax=Oldenlandia corymbosa var. corymbosa TaxID=529605 RepID=A0AAV1D6L5_OLDCO|nr:OLC1v1001704C1 [Oldenlandia corymbosa var. corymbosa]